ncbi:enoyl-CoA hydratase [Pseudomaricurvus alkylphenolicus]|uniref:enoyl-CoA hydratase-related protein n=1 Tax=Pseudomaricurvus alkylphenolicus TaxID=1306991 RepID=UPI0014223EB6|nr:enoyl-CoA hydratase-related protein [Pseudomaricurvus alkylphenolicus]NIB38195.1 enoyl-CoA hydratase [Pseudomaricurvus alkylphenolicus]
MSTFKDIIASTDRSVAYIGLNRSEKKNALTPEMYKAIEIALVEADSNNDIKVIVLYGVDGVFCAGTDISGLNRDPGETSPLYPLLLALQEIKKPIIAAVSGLAVGIGTTILLHCDLVYAERGTRFRMPFSNLGLCPEAGSSLLLPLVAGHRLAAEVLLLGEFFSADHARELGLVNGVVEDGRAMEHASQKALLLSSKASTALIETKKLLKMADKVAVRRRIEEEFEVFNQLLQTPDSIAVRSRFLNKK